MQIGKKKNVALKTEVRQKVSEKHNAMVWQDYCTAVMDLFIILHNFMKEYYYLVQTIHLADSYLNQHAVNSDTNPQ